MPNRLVPNWRNGVVDDSDELGLASTDASGFSSIVARHLPFLSAVAAREVGTADAEDLVQEALLRAWRRRQTFDAQRGSARSWLVAIVLDQARRAGTRRRPTGTLDPTPITQTSEARIDLQRAIDALPRRQQQVITLHYLADLKVSEVAALLGVTDGTVKSTLSNARQALHAAMEQYQ